MSGLIDFDHLERALDLWQCMWTPEEQAGYETALLRAMTEAHPRAIQLHALAACHVIGTPRLFDAAVRAAESDAFGRAEIDAIERETLGLYNLMQAAARLRGKHLTVEHLLARVVTGPDPESDALLDRVDARDLIAVARVTPSMRIYREVERRIARRGRYQRGRVANLLGWKTRPAVSGDRAGQSPEIGELQPTGT